MSEEQSPTTDHPVADSAAPNMDETQTQVTTDRSVVPDPPTTDQAVAEHKDKKSTRAKKNELAKPEAKTEPVERSRLRRSPLARELRDEHALKTVLTRVLGIGMLEAEERAKTLQDKSNEILAAYRAGRLEDIHNLLDPDSEAESPDDNAPSGKKEAATKRQAKTKTSKPK